MIAYDIYLKTAFELLIKERVRSYLFRLPALAAPPKTVEEMFESVGLISEVPLKPKDWKEDYEKDINNVKEFAENYYNSIIVHQDAEQDFLEWKEILTEQQKSAKKIPTSGVSKDVPASGLSINIDHFSDFYNAARKIWNDQILGWTWDDDLVELYSKLIWGNSKIDADDEDTKHTGQIVDLKHCSMNWYAENLPTGHLTGISTDSEEKRTLRQWIDEEVQDDPQTVFTNHRKKFKTKCDAKKNKAENFMLFKAVQMNHNEAYYKYAAWHHKVLVTDGFINSLIERKSLDLYLFAAYCLKTDFSIFDEEKTKEQLQKQGKHHLKTMFKQIYEEDMKQLITNTTELNPAVIPKLKEFDNLIDFSIFSLINEMDK